MTVGLLLIDLYSFTESDDENPKGLGKKIIQLIKKIFK